MRVRALTAPGMLALLIAVACGSSGDDSADGEEPPTISCEPGDTRPCEGADACKTPAVQTCMRTGVGWSACACERNPGAGGAAGAAGAGGEGGEASSTGGTSSSGTGGVGGSGGDSASSAGGSMANAGAAGELGQAGQGN